MTRAVHHPTRRLVIMSAVAGPAAIGVARFGFGDALAAGRRRAYVASGAGAASLLDDPDYHKVFEAIFSGLDTTFAAAPSREALLDGMMAADVVYLSVHSNRNVIAAEGGELVSIGDIIRRRRTAGHAPRLVVIAGCLTLDNKTRTTLPRAFGVEESGSGAAYIGFTTTIVGKNVDAFFRVFFSLWLRPDKAGHYRTLEEAREEALAFIEARIEDNQAIAAAGNTDAGKMMKFAAGVPNVGRKMTIVGDGGLRLTDLDRPAVTTAPSTSEGTPTGAGSPGETGPATPTNPPSTNGAGTAGGSTWTPSGGSGWSPSGGNGSRSPTTSGGSPGGGDADAINQMLKR
ncbi:MAG: hypothetical protein LWW93_15885 [Hyphomicrobiales bacterium]|nr:hypothetical protein [Hyphomicrobiales bacterium]